MSVTSAFGLSFEEQSRFFASKISLPTQHWDDIQKSAHDRAFIVAGAQKADLLSDLKSSVQAGIDGQLTLEGFRKQFDAIVAKHGWTNFTGADSEAGRAWRTRLIYETNLRTSYAAGRYQQLTEHADAFPYWEYKHSDGVAHPRPQHVAWDGLVLPYNDPWWQIHYPPNGWGCHCYVRGVSQRGMQQLGKSGPDEAPLPEIDPGTGLEQGIDKGWDYAPGANVLRPLKNFIDQKLIRLDAPIGAAMWAELRPVLQVETATAYREWLAEIGRENQQAKSITPILGAIEPQDVRWLNDRGIYPSSAEIGIHSGLINGPKAKRHEKKFDAISWQVWESLPEMLMEPLAVCFDSNSGNLLYVLPEATAHKPQLAVEFNFQAKNQGEINLIVSGYRPLLEDLQARIRNQSLILIRGEIQ